MFKITEIYPNLYALHYTVIFENVFALFCIISVPMTDVNIHLISMGLKARTPVANLRNLNECAALLYTIRGPNFLCPWKQPEGNTWLSVTVCARAMVGLPAAQSTLIEAQS